MATATLSISASVGAYESGSVNRREDVRLVQQILQKVSENLKNRAYYPGTDDGKIARNQNRSATVKAIIAYQRRFLSKPDARVDPNGTTWRNMMRDMGGVLPGLGGPQEDEEDVTKIPSGTGPFFPFTKLPKAGWHWTTGWRRFGSNRSSGKRAHAGCDLYFPEGTPIHAVKDGTVIRGPYDFYAKTEAIEVDHGTFLIRYGEIKPGSATSKKHVSAGEVIARVGHLVGISVPSDMLHLEMYSKKASGRLTVYGAASAKRSDGIPFNRRKDLVDPTPYLNQWKNNLPK